MFQHKKSLFLFLLPGLAGILIFYTAPFSGGIYYALTDGTSKANIIGLHNFAAVLENRMFQTGLINSLLLSAFCVPPVWVLGFLTAFYIDRQKKATAVLRNVIFLPYVLPSSAVLLFWLMAFDDSGIVNQILSWFGLERIMFLSSPAMRIPVVFLFIWKNFGFAVIVYLSAMQSIPEILYESAVLDGAGFFSQCIHITLPHIVPTAFLVLLIEWVNAFRIFREVYLIGGAYPVMEVYTLQHFMNNMYSRLNYQYVTSAAYIFTFFLFIFFGSLFISQKLIVKRLEGNAD